MNIDVFKTNVRVVDDALILCEVAKPSCETQEGRKMSITNWHIPTSEPYTFSEIQHQPITYSWLPQMKCTGTLCI